MQWSRTGLAEPIEETWQWIVSTVRHIGYTFWRLGKKLRAKRRSREDASHH